MLRVGWGVGGGGGGRERGFCGKCDWVFGLYFTCLFVFNTSGKVVQICDCKLLKGQTRFLSSSTSSR